MSKVTIYSTGTCPLCDKSKTLLAKWGITYEEKRVDLNQDNLAEMHSISNGARTVPQIVIQGKWIGGFSELTELHMDGELDELIEKK